MTFVNKYPIAIAVVAAGGLAALSLGLATPSYAAEASKSVNVHAEMHAKPRRLAWDEEAPRQKIVRFGDLDLSKPAGRQALQSRLARAARQVCDMPNALPYAEFRAAERECRDETLRVAMAEVAPVIMLAADR